MSETHRWRLVKRAHSTLEGRDIIPRQCPYAILGISLLNAQMAHATEDTQYRRSRIEIPVEIVLIIDVESKQCLIGDISASEPEQGPEKG